MDIAELKKNQYDKGRVSNITFYRERSGKEVDAMVRNSEGLHLYEVKTGTTFKSENAINMKYEGSLLSDVTQRTVIYDAPTSNRSL